MNLRRLLNPDLDLFNAFRRHVEQRMDQAMALSWRKLAPGKPVQTFDGEPRFALLTVNFSTTYYLKLMLLTLCEQDNLQSIYRIIIVDNHSRDGGVPFLRRLAAAVGRLHLIENRFFCSHARGMRQGVAFLDRCEASEATNMKSNLLLFCDTDIIFRNRETLTDIATALAAENTAFAGELRHHLYPYPEAQASFFGLRRDCYARADVAPFVHHGAPAYWMQRSLWRAGLQLADFPSNSGNYILHRDRSGVAAARQHHPLSASATVTNPRPHYMGITGGADIRETTEQHFSDWLRPEREGKLVGYLSGKLKVLAKNG